METSRAVISVNIDGRVTEIAEGPIMGFKVHYGEGDSIEGWSWTIVWRGEPDTFAFVDAPR